MSIYRTYKFIPYLFLLSITAVQAETENSRDPATTTVSETTHNDVYRWLDDHGIYPNVLLRSKLFYSIDYGLAEGQNKLEEISLLALNLDLDLAKLMGIPGASFHMETESNFTRRNNAIGSSFGSFPLAQLPPNAPRRDVPVFSYAQRLFDDRLVLDMGRKNVTWFFVDQYSQLEAGSSMDAITWLTGPPPFATWMFQGTATLGNNVYVKTGFWEYNVQNWGYDGWNFRTNGASGTTSLFSLGYGESLAETRYPQHVEVTGYYVNAAEAAPYTGQDHKGNRGIIARAGKMVTRFDSATSGDPNGLYLYGLYGANLKPWNMAGVSYNATLGMAWTQAFNQPGDVIGVKYNHTRLTKEKWQALDEASIASGGTGNTHGRDSAFVMLYGSFAFNRFLSINPYIAYGFSPNRAYNPYTFEQPQEGFFTGAIVTLNISDLIGLPKYRP